MEFSIQTLKTIIGITDKCADLKWMNIKTINKTSLNLIAIGQSQLNSSSVVVSTLISSSKDEIIIHNDIDKFVYISELKQAFKKKQLSSSSSTLKCVINILGDIMVFEIQLSKNINISYAVNTVDVRHTMITDYDISANDILSSNEKIAHIKIKLPDETYNMISLCRYSEKSVNIVYDENMLSIIDKNMINIKCESVLFIKKITVFFQMIVYMDLWKHLMYINSIPNQIEHVIMQDGSLFVIQTFKKTAKANLHFEISVKIPGHLILYL